MYQSFISDLPKIESADETLERLRKTNLEFAKEFDFVMNNIYPTCIIDMSGAYNMVANTTGGYLLVPKEKSIVNEIRKTNCKERHDILYLMYDKLDYLEKTLKTERRKLNNGGNGGVIYYGPQKRLFNDFYDAIEQMIRQHDPSPFYEKLETINTEIVNGYQMYNGGEVFDKKTFDKLLIIWNNNKQYTPEEFYDQYDSLACSDWSKMDRHGECYGGFWKYPEDSYEKANAYDLSRKDNGLALYQLPYPKEIVLKTIKYGCNNRHESVRYSNFLCEWIKRKINQMKPQNRTLKSLCVSAIKTFGESTYDLPEDLKELFK